MPPITLRNLAPLEDSYRNYWSTTDIGRTITVSQPGLYWLQASTVQGCTASDSILISPNCYVGIPNAFTPNGDGVNDYFFPSSLFSRGVTTFHMAIYSRWGQLMYETDNINDKGWDGKFNGVMQPQSVFVYLIEATFTDGTSQQYKGNVSLLR
jgi:gliding motility-associated-like protein